MYDVLLPVHSRESSSARDALHSLIEHSDVPLRIVAVFCGPERSDFAEIESAVKGCGCEHVILSTGKTCNMIEGVRAGMEHLQSELALIATANVRMTDPLWFGKMQQVFLKDPLCGVVDTEPHTQSSSLQPVRRSLGREPSDGCPLMMVRKRFITAAGMPLSLSLARWLHTRAFHLGSNSWAMPGVSYYITETPSWSESSGEAEESSESPSQTTPVSSTPTASEPDSSLDFGL